MISFDDAKSQVLERAFLLQPTDIAVDSALSLTLVSDLIAPIDLPPFDNSAMDGFALVFDDVRSGGGVHLPVSQKIMAGDFPAALEAHTCAKIMTGAAMPCGADTVLPIEDVTVESDFIVFHASPKQGQHVRFKGEDIARGEIAAKCGEVVTSRHIALFAALGLTHVIVRRKPAVTIIITGNELVPPGTALKPGQIYDSNGPALSAALSEMGIRAKCFAAPDDAEKIKAMVTRGLENSDILITVGGVSVGDSDHVKVCLESLGASLVFWRVAMKPGKPVAFWTMGKKLIFGLPGNPVSCMVTFELFVKSAILKMMGRKENPKRNAIAAKKFSGSKGKRDFICGRFSRDGERIIVEPSGPAGSAMIKSLVNANCLVVIPEEMDCVDEGQLVEIALLQ